MKASIKDKLLLFLGSLFLLVLLGLLAFDVTRKGIYRSKMGINVAVVGNDGVGILLLRPDEEMVGWVRLPVNIRLKIFSSDARYPLESLWNYGMSLKNPFGIMEKSLGQSMGVVVSRTIKLNEGTSMENVLGELFSLSTKTDLSIRDRVMMRSFLADALKSKKVLELTLPESVFDKVTDPDGKSFIEFNSTMGLWTKNKFIIEPILDENADVSINNISSVSGLGGALANQLESAGMHVMELIANLDESVEGKGCLYSSSKRYEMTESVLREQVGCLRISQPSFVEIDEKIRIWIK